MTDKQRAALETKRGLGRVQRDYTLENVQWDTRALPATMTIGTSGTVHSTTGTTTVRANTDSSTLVDFTGHASVTGKGYDMYGGPNSDMGGWTEYIDSGAFKRTLNQNADVAFLLNHDGVTLARTKAGTMTLTEDKVGLKVNATLDTRVNIVNDIRILMQAGNLDEMSIGFRIVKQSWLTKDGEEVPWWDLAGIERHIQEINMDKGDVSLVNYGANPYTDANVRSLTDMLRNIEQFDETDVRAAITLLEARLPPEVESGCIETVLNAQRRAFMARHNL